MTNKKPSTEASAYAVGSCDYKIGNYDIWVDDTLGSGYSGTVHRVSDQAGRPYALKLSKAKHMNPKKNDILFDEYQKLLTLSRNGVPVPQPKAFFGFADDHNWGQTGILMELIQGHTLREWVNRQPHGYIDTTSGRTIHPVVSVSNAAQRIDCAVSVIQSLSILQRMGMFVDMKPRNLMITDSRVPRCMLVDAGGMLLAGDLGLECMACVYIQPLRCRPFMETTSSYLSPELASIVCEFDRHRGRLSSHFKTTVHENHFDADEIYLLSRDRLSKSKILNENNEVFLGEASSVFIFGLVLNEMFGGSRTGLTSLTRLPTVRQQFDNYQKYHDVEFRCALQWNEYIPELGCSYQELYKKYCYPKTGLFSAEEGGDVGLKVENILDRCFEFNPYQRANFDEILNELLNLRDNVLKTDSLTKGKAESIRCSNENFA